MLRNFKVVHLINMGRYIEFYVIGLAVLKKKNKFQNWYTAHEWAMPHDCSRYCSQNFTKIKKTKQFEASLKIFGRKF